VGIGCRPGPRFQHTSGDGAREEFWRLFGAKQVPSVAAGEFDFPWTVECGDSSGESLSFIRESRVSGPALYSKRKGGSSNMILLLVDIRLLLGRIKALIYWRKRRK
jgi:hypothetical protein